MNAIQIQKVTMYHYNPEMNKTFESVFDFQNLHTTPNKWTVYYPDKQVTILSHQTQTGANNNTTSDFWIYSTSRFDLAKVQLTYDFPKTIIGNGIIKGLSVYVSGSNLLTLAKEREILEMNVGSAPQSRFYNIGATVAF